MRMTCCVDLRACFVNRRVDREGRSVDGLVALDNLASFSDED